MDKTKIKKEYIKFKNEVDKKQAMATMLESIVVLGKYLPNEEVKSDEFYRCDFYGNNTHLEVDIAHTNFYSIFYKMLPELIENDFIIDLEGPNIDGLDDWLENIDTTNMDYQRIVELKRNYYNMRTSFDILRRYDIEKSVDLVKLFTNNRMYEILMNLFVSDEVALKHKFHILAELLNKDCAFERFLKTVPSTYMIDEWSTNVKRESFTKILNKNLKEVGDTYRRYFNIIVFSNINKSIYQSNQNADSIIKNLVNFNLVDINEITFEYQGTIITAAAAAYIKRRDNLSKYLYELPSYAEGDSKIRDDSDKILLSLGNVHSKNGFDWLISRKNFINTSDKMLYILDLIDKSNSGEYDFNYIYTEKDINKIIDTLVRKTKKEDYKEVKKMLVDRENRRLSLVNEQVLLEQKRQELTCLLRSLNDTLLESVPARKKIKEIEFKNNKQ